MKEPGYWRAETSGVLAPVIERYLKNESLTPKEIATMRAYLRQWIASPVWDENPHQGQEGADELFALRASAFAIANQKDIDAWIARAIEFGVDPL